MIDKDVIQSMPKAELHAHLSGSITMDTMIKLKTLKNLDGSKVGPNFCHINQPKTLDEVFHEFGAVHQLMDTYEAIYLATCDVIQDFAKDNVRYLELRTTPRIINGTFDLYADAVLKAIDDCRENGLPIVVKLLFSIDRSRGVETAEKVVNLAISYGRLRPDVVRGLDVSGNMVGSKVVDYFPLLNKIRAAGLGLTIHTAEIHDDEETEAILRFKPDRIGHGTYIPPMRCNNPALLKLFMEQKIPIEVCLTSNLVSGTVASFEDHHLKTLLDCNAPVAICTDDKGLFGTTLSEEYRIACETFSLSMDDIWNISTRTLDYAFLSPTEKQDMKLVWEDWKKSHQDHFPPQHL